MFNKSDKKWKKSIYCIINSFDNISNKLTISFLDDIVGNLDDLISITIFTLSSPNYNKDIFDIDTFNHINIIPYLEILYLK